MSERNSFDKRIIDNFDKQMDRPSSGLSTHELLDYYRLHRGGVDHSQVQPISTGDRNAQMLNQLNVFGTRGYQPPEMQPLQQQDTLAPRPEAASTSRHAHQDISSVASGPFHSNTNDNTQNRVDHIPIQYSGGGGYQPDGPKFRVADINLLMPADRNQQGLHLTHQYAQSIEVHIPWDVIRLSGVSYNHAADISTTLNNYIPSSSSKQDIYNAFRHIKKNNPIESIGQWQVRIVN